MSEYLKTKCERCGYYGGAHTEKCSESTGTAGYVTDLEKAEERLLNAFQLIKNGKQISYLKFEEFKKMLDKERDHNGNIVT